jgi:hypothetical protein
VPQCREHAQEQRSRDWQPASSVQLCETAHKNTSALQIVEQAKACHPALCLEAFQHLFQLEDTGAQLNGLALLRHVVASSWNELAKEQRQVVVQLVHSAVTSSDFVSMAAPVKTQLAYAVSEVAVRGGTEVVQHTVSSIVVRILQKGMEF